MFTYSDLSSLNILVCRDDIIALLIRKLLVSIYPTRNTLLPTINL